MQKINLKKFHLSFLKNFACAQKVGFPRSMQSNLWFHTRHAIVDNTKLNIQSDQPKLQEDDGKKTSQLVQEEKAKSGNVCVKFWSCFSYVIALLQLSSTAMVYYFTG